MPQASSALSGFGMECAIVGWNTPKYLINKNVIKINSGEKATTISSWIATAFHWSWEMEMKQEGKGRGGVESH